MSNSNIFYVHLSDGHKSMQNKIAVQLQVKCLVLTYLMLSDGPKPMQSITDINEKLSVESYCWDQRIPLIAIFIFYPSFQETEGDIYVRYHPALGITVMALCVANVSILFIVINMYMNVIKAQTCL